MIHTVKDNVLTIEIPLVTEDQYPWRDNESISNYQQHLKDIASIRANEIVKEIKPLVQPIISGKDIKPWRHI